MQGSSTLKQISTHFRHDFTTAITVLSAREIFLIAVLSTASNTCKKHNGRTKYKGFVNKISHGTTFSKPIILPLPHSLLIKKRNESDLHKKHCDDINVESFDHTPAQELHVLQSPAQAAAKSMMPPKAVCCLYYKLLQNHNQSRRTPEQPGAGLRMCLPRQFCTHGRWLTSEAAVEPRPNRRNTEERVAR